MYICTEIHLDKLILKTSLFVSLHSVFTRKICCALVIAILGKNIIFRKWKLEKNIYIYIKSLSKK